MADQFAHGLWIILAMSLVVSALVARRIPMVRLLAMTLGWVALFFGVFVLFSAVGPQITAWQQGRREGVVKPTTGTDSGGAATGPDLKLVVNPGTSLTIPVSDDGHYWIDAKVNGQTVRFLIDSGASITAVSKDVALQLALPPDPMGAGLELQTANGPVEADRSVISAMEVGPISAQDLPVAVSSAFGDVNVLGMNFLGKLKSWRVEGGKMVLEAS